MVELNFGEIYRRLKKHCVSYSPVYDCEHLNIKVKDMTVLKSVGIGTLMKLQTTVYMAELNSMEIYRNRLMKFENIHYI